MTYAKFKPQPEIKIGDNVRVKHYVHIPAIATGRENNMTAKVQEIMLVGNVILDRDLRGSKIWHKNELIVLENENE